MYIYGKLSNIKDISHKMSDEDGNEFEDDYAFKKNCELLKAEFAKQERNQLLICKYINPLCASDAYLRQLIRYLQ